MLTWTTMQSVIGTLHSRYMCACVHVHTHTHTTRIIILSWWVEM